MTNKLRGFAAGFLTLFCVNTVSSQSLWTVNSAQEGWFVSGAIGAHGYVGDFDRQRNFGSCISVGGEVAVGKWITPLVGLQLQAGGYNMQGMNASLSNESFNYGLVHGDIMVDAVALFGGVNEERFYTFVPYMGFGSGIRTNSAYNGFIFTMGGVNRFRLSDHVDANVELKGVLFQDKFDGAVGGRKHDGALALTAGFTYKF